MNQFDFYKELYHKENERRFNVSNALNIPITIISAISAGIFFFITNYNYDMETNLNWLFYLPITLSILSTIISILFLIKVFTQFKNTKEYADVPFTQELYIWHQELIKHYGNKKTADKAFKKYLKEKLAMIVEQNMYVNDKKFQLIVQSKRWTTISLLFILLSFFPFTYNYLNSPSKLQKVEIELSKDYSTEIKNISIKIDSLTQVFKTERYEPTKKRGACENGTCQNRTCKRTKSTTTTRCKMD